MEVEAGPRSAAGQLIAAEHVSRETYVCQGYILRSLYLDERVAPSRRAVAVASAVPQMVHRRHWFWGLPFSVCGRRSGFRALDGPATSVPIAMYDGADRESWIGNSHVRASRPATDGGQTKIGSSAGTQDTRIRRNGPIGAAQHTSNGSSIRSTDTARQPQRPVGSLAVSYLLPRTRCSDSGTPTALGAHFILDSSGSD